MPSVTKRTCAETSPPKQMTATATVAQRSIWTVVITVWHASLRIKLGLWNDLLRPAGTRPFQLRGGIRAIVVVIHLDRIQLVRLQRDGPGVFRRRTIDEVIND